MSQEFSPTTRRIAALVQRFMDVDRKNHQDRTYPNWSKFQANPVARAQGFAVHSVVAAADEFRRNVEKWFGSGFAFRHLADNWTASLHDAQKFEQLLRVHAPIAMNSQHLKSVLEDLRRQSKDFRTFDQTIHVEGAAGIKLDAAQDGWNRNGSKAVLTEVVELIRTKLGVEVTLLNDDEAVEHALVVLEQYATSYEMMMNHAMELSRASYEATKD